MPLTPGEVPHRLHLLVGRREIALTVRRLAREVGRDYRGLCPVLVGVLRGAFIFLADLVRALDMPLEVEFVRLASYGAGTTPGRARLLARPDTPLGGRHVLLVEDIVDTGQTTARLLKYLGRQGPASLRVCTLLDKAERRRVPVPLHYVGLRVPDRFLVGYGLDWADRYRYLPAVYAVEFLEEG